MTEGETLYELGIDVKSSFTFHDGDIQLVEYDENLVQSILNQLNTDLDELDLFYEDYGSVMLSFLGWKANEETLTLIQAELDTLLQSEERLDSWESEIKYTGNGKIQIDLRLHPNPEYTIETTFIVSDEGVVEGEEEEEE